MSLFTQIQLHDHSSVFGVAEVLFAIAAELSVCLCHIAAQRLLKLLRDAAPRNHIAHAGVPYIHDAGPVAVLLRMCSCCSVASLPCSLSGCRVTSA